MGSKVEEYRRKAREAETRAILAHDPKIKEQFEQICREWQHLSYLAAQNGW